MIFISCRAFYFIRCKPSTSLKILKSPFGAKGYRKLKEQQKKRTIKNINFALPLNDLRHFALPLKVFRCCCPKLVYKVCFCCHCHGCIKHVTDRYGSVLVRNRLRLCLRLQVNNVNTVESLACSSVWQHFRQAQETRQQRLEWRDLSPCVSMCVCLCGKVDHLKVAHCFGFFSYFGKQAARLHTGYRKSAKKPIFSCT